MGLLSSVASVVGAGTQLAGALGLFGDEQQGTSGKKAAKEGQRQSELSRQYAQALVNPQSELYQRLYQQERTDAYNDFLMALSAHEKHQKRAMARGELPTFTTSVDPSIRDSFREKLTSTLLHGPNQQRLARDRARQVLAQAGNLLSNQPANIAGAQQNIGQAQRNTLGGSILSGVQAAQNVDDYLGAQSSGAPYSIYGNTQQARNQFTPQQFTSILTPGGGR